MARTKRSADAPKAFSSTPGDPIGTFHRMGSHGEPEYVTFWHGSEQDCLAAIWREYVANDRQPWTVRHYYYVLKNAGLLKTATDRYPQGADNANNWVSVLLANARESELWGKEESWRLVTDTGVVRSHYYHSGSLREHIADLARQYYTVDRWRGQATRVVLCTEKEGLYAFLENIADDYGVDVLAFGGNESVTVKHDAAVEWQAILDGGKNVQLLYVGDLDPGGIDIERDFARTITHYGYRGLPPQRIAVTTEQIPEIAPESEQPISDATNNKAKTFRRDYPTVRYGYQVEGLPGRRLRELVENAIRAYVDVAEMNDAIELGNAVGEWLTERVTKAIQEYEDYNLSGRRLHQVIMEGWWLIDPRTQEPFPQDVVRRYLGEVGDGDGEAEVPDDEEE